jgi:hypothetical protein
MSTIFCLNCVNGRGCVKRMALLTSIFTCLDTLSDEWLCSLLCLRLCDLIFSSIFTLGFLNIIKIISWIERSNF